MVASVDLNNTRPAGIAMPRTDVSAVGLGYLGAASTACGRCAPIFRHKGRS